MTPPVVVASTSVSEGHLSMLSHGAVYRRYMNVIRAWVAALPQIYVHHLTRVEGIITCPSPFIMYDSPSHQPTNQALNTRTEHDNGNPLLERSRWPPSASPIPTLTTPDAIDVVDTGSSRRCGSKLEQERWAMHCVVSWLRLGASLVESKSDGDFLTWLGR